MSYHQRKKLQLNNRQGQNKNQDIPPGRDDGRYCVWCRHYIPKQAHHKTELCPSMTCKQRVPLRPGYRQGYNLPWTHCVECDSYIRMDFHFCQNCAQSTDAGEGFLRKKRAADQAAAFRAKQLKLDDVLLGAIPIPIGVSEHEKKDAPEDISEKTSGTEKPQQGPGSEAPS